MRFTQFEKTDAVDMSSPAEKVIEAFGGLTKLAREYGCPVSTVQGWKERGRIPQEHWLGIIQSAARNDISIRLEDFLPQPERAA